MSLEIDASKKVFNSKKCKQNIVFVQRSLLLAILSCMRCLFDPKQLEFNYLVEILHLQLQRFELHPKMSVVICA